MYLIAHEAADLFPLMDGARFGELVEDIQANGLRHKIILCGGKLLDGRNRYEACVKLGIVTADIFEKYEGDPFAYAWSANGQRRDLSGDQRAAIWLEVEIRSGEWKKRGQQVEKRANEARSEAAKERPRKPGGESGHRVHFAADGSKRITKADWEEGLS